MKTQMEKLEMSKRGELPVNFLDCSVEPLCKGCTVNRDRLNNSSANTKYWGF